MGIILKYSFLSLCIVSLFGSCIKEPEQNGENLVDNFERKEMLINLSENYIIPAYQDYNLKLTELSDACNLFSISPNSVNFEDLKLKYINSLHAWQKVSFLDFGPATNIVLADQTNTFPVDTVLINTNVLSASYNLGSIANYSAKGFQTIDYLLYGEKDVQSNLDSLINVPAKVTYITDVIDDLKSNADYVSNNWQTYKTTFQNNSSSNASGSAVSELANGIIAHYESYIRKGKIGLPIGIFNGFSQNAMPGHVEGYYSNQTLLLASSAMVAYKDFLNGVSFDGNSDKLGLLDYANFVDARVNNSSLANAVNLQINKILAANELSILPWSEMVVQNPPTSNDIYLEYQKLIPLLKVDLTSALGIIIVYQDNDGD